MGKKLSVDRTVPQGGLDESLTRLNFCLNLLEEQGFAKNIDWNTKITERLTLEEVIGALVTADQVLKEHKEEVEYQETLEE